MTTNPKTSQNAHELKKEIRRTVAVKYLLYVPKEYERGEKCWPLMLFLHGAGERGDNLGLVKKHGPPKIAEQRDDFPFVLLSPQCPDGHWWRTDVLNVLLDEIVAEYRIDEDRVYVTGLSMGGYGTWALAIEYPNRFAAIAPVCGGGIPLLTRRIAHLPVWVFHGAKDTTVPLEESQRMVDALKRFGGNVKFTVYPEAKHDSWTQAYGNPELYEWFLRHQRAAD